MPGGPELTRLHFAPEGATRRPSEEHLTTLEFLGQGAAQRSGGRYEPLPRWGNPRRAVVAGLLAAALLGAVVHGGLVSTARGADPPVSDQAPSERLRGAPGGVSVEGDTTPRDGRDTEVFGPPSEVCVDLPERGDEPRGSRGDGSGRTDLHRGDTHAGHPPPVRGDLFVGGDYLTVRHLPVDHLSVDRSAGAASRR